MKKLNLEMLRLSTEEVLERSQMKKITGGYGGTYNYYCTCKGSVGTWYGNYSSPNGALDSISNWCASGYGTCLYGNYQI
ncbi:MAG: hypothetical protein HLUCCX10_08745 [Algoriphagus marincola HL-49]|uniref:Natural product n=1 Tax=Algoriphagus marincola HL-49 TaxID=1305737 RepID=A0A0P7XI09_9BACT|nr:MAG: hypothetical protein HLUCCX10_08745 [Algoriphagus marincola HL-49]